MTEPAWLADPTGRHQARFWNGREWTDQVADNGVAGLDPPTMAPPSAPATPAFAAPTPPVSSPQRQPGSRRWWIVVVALVAVAAIVAVIANRDSKPSAASGGSSSGGSGGGGRARVEFTDAHGYKYVVEHTGAVQLQRIIQNVSPGFAVIHVTGGKVSVANVNSGRNAPMPTVRLLAYLPVPDCDTQKSLIGDVETKVSLPDSCLLEIDSAWSLEADHANGMSSIDSLLGAVLQPDQTAVAPVDETWFDIDARSVVADTVDVSGPFTWGIEVGNFDPTGPSSCVIHLFGDNAHLQELTATVAQINRTGDSDPVGCDVVPG